MSLSKRIKLSALLAAATATVLLTTSCSTGLGSSSLTKTTVDAAGQGRVMGGAIPIVGANITIWQVGSAGVGSAASSIMNTSVTTDGNGEFNLTGKYNCPTGNTLVYVTSVGGNPGIGSINSQAVLMTALGPCGGVPSMTYIEINEVTTVAAVAGLNPFLLDYGQVGYGTGTGQDLPALTSGFATAGALVDIARGAAGSGQTTANGAPVEQINALSNVLAYCVNSRGGIAGDGSPCGTLFQQIKTATGNSIAATNTVLAAHLIADDASNSTLISSTYNDIPINAPFSPYLTAAPGSWAITALPLAATVTFSSLENATAGSGQVELSDTTPSVTIHYTLDGSTPTLYSQTYTSGTPIQLSGASNSVQTVKAIAYGFPAGYATSAVGSAAFTLP